MREYPAAGAVHGVQVRKVMNRSSVIFLLLALLFAGLGLGGVLGAATVLAKLLFVVFVVLFAMSLATRFLRSV